MEDHELIDERDYRVVQVLKAMANGLRYELVRLLMESPQSVSELAERVDRTVSSVSHQLSTLDAKNLVQSRTEGKQNIYRPKRRDVIEKIFELRSLLKREEE